MTRPAKTPDFTDEKTRISPPGVRPAVPPPQQQHGRGAGHTLLWAACIAVLLGIVCGVVLRVGFQHRAPLPLDVPSEPPGPPRPGAPPAAAPPAAAPPAAPEASDPHDQKQDPALDRRRGSRKRR